MFTEEKIEKIVLILVSLTFFVGIWHGFPFTNVVADEGFFSGSVLRAIEHHSFLPLPLDVPYGTITYYVSYVFISAFLAILTVLFSFDISHLQLFVIGHPYIIYGISRLVSVALALFCLYGFNWFLKQYVTDYRVRLTLIVLLFTDILVNIVFHTSKVWVLSTTLQLVSLSSMILATNTIEENKTKKYIWTSVISAFLSFANFPLMGMNLLVIPIILYFNWNKPSIKKTLLKSSAAGFVIFASLVFSNFTGIKAQVLSIIFDYTLSPGALATNASIGLSTFLHLKKVIVMFPLLILMFLYMLYVSKIKHRPLFFISGLYLLTYMGLLIFIDRWSLVDKAALRYSFPIPFFLTYLIASFDFPYRKIFFLPVLISIIYLIPTLFFLSVPTTSHKAVDFIKKQFSQNGEVAFFNEVGADTPIPQNKSSYELFKEQECGSKCKATLKYNLENDFQPLVLDSHTEPTKLKEVISSKTVYFVFRAATTSPAFSLEASFKTPVKDLNYYSADNSGSYFDLAYFRLKRFGPNIYIYKSLTH